MTTQRLDLKSDITATDHRRGPENALVTIVEYGDFECPYCAQAHESLSAALQAMPQARLVFRQFPLSDIHRYAELAAEASEAAAVQGKFWEMHDLLFENQRFLDGEYIVSFAEKLGLDMDPFIDMVNNRSQKARVRVDLDSGIASDVSGTPSFFINGMRYRGGYSAEELISIIRRLS